MSTSSEAFAARSELSAGGACGQGRARGEMSSQADTVAVVRNEWGATGVAELNAQCEDWISDREGSEAGELMIAER